ncbi:uncharacterized protein C9orf152 [Stegastes partitus]|uniref:Uncharacterized protein C9orf152 n=1 Tax=Stegastes partitus TaxID=144197 RepID=A0A9Y4KKZ8_9TELE|nr:PREDICTED: uncharacterized protein C9orf152 homolog [Stegastes partitus]
MIDGGACSASWPPAAAGVSCGSQVTLCPPPAAGIREEQDRMDVSVLRQRYRSSREAQRSRAQVLLLRTVSEDAVSVVAVAQGLTSPWEPNSTPDPDPTCDPTCDPWRAHLDLHRRCCPGGLTRPPSSDSCSESGDRKLSAGSDSLSSSRDENRLPAAPDGSRDELRPDRRDGGGGLQRELQPRQQEASGGVLQSSGSRKVLSRQQSAGCYPFPSRKTPRISEAARRLGMYSSF